MCHTVRKGSTGKLLLINLRDASGLGPKTGARHDTEGASAAYVREGEGAVRPVSLRPCTLGRHEPGGFVEVDAELLPGIYQFGAPNEMLAAGADSVTLALRFPDALFEPLTISLVAYDPQDADRLGMEAIGPEQRIRALRGAFPLVAARELDELGGRAGE
jgi:hypothetical protein